MFDFVKDLVDSCTEFVEMEGSEEFVEIGLNCGVVDVCFDDFFGLESDIADV